ncbi:MAG: Rieske 2Fe-2S domain-containing protein, partial [Deltaproteobacteria bacterium]|nr:Rieske 2Fe-2S domain-containing protein [Deltaproteobacteria bacterium]
VLPSTEAPSALVLRCSHLGCALTTLAGKDGFVCPCHASRFDAAGRPTRGPAVRPLDRVPLHRVGRDWIARMDEVGRG